MLTIGTTAPDFSLYDQEGREQTLSAYRGQYVLVYFYPKDDTPGCTQEACTIRDIYHDFEKNNIIVFGISHDTVESHKKFALKYELPFLLLSDPTKKIIGEYAAGKGFLGARRISYLLDPHGIIVKVYPTVTPADHAGEVLLDIKKLIG